MASLTPGQSMAADLCGITSVMAVALVLVAVLLLKASLALMILFPSGTVHSCEGIQPLRCVGSPAEKPKEHLNSRLYFCGCLIPLSYGASS